MIKYRLDYICTVCVDIKSDFDLRNTSGSWGDTSKIESAQQMVVFGQRPFSFVDFNSDGLLVIRVCGKDLAFFGWNVGSLWNDFGHDPTNSFDTQG